MRLRFRWVLVSGFFLLPAYARALDNLDPVLALEPSAYRQIRASLNILAHPGNNRAESAGASSGSQLTGAFSWNPELSILRRYRMGFELSLSQVAPTPSPAGFLTAGFRWLHVFRCSETFSLEAGAGLDVWRGWTLQAARELKADALKQSSGTVSRWAVGPAITARMVDQLEPRLGRFVDRVFLGFSYKSIASLNSIQSEVGVGTSF